MSLYVHKLVLFICVCKDNECMIHVKMKVVISNIKQDSTAYLSVRIKDM